MAFCESQLCDWSELADTEQEAAILMVCHFLTKHPDRYHLVTGRDPEEARKLYAEHLERLKEKI